MEDKLKSFVSQQRESFDDASPKDFIWDEIDKNISKSERANSTRTNLFKMVGVAASVLFIFTIGYQLRMSRTVEPETVQKMEAITALSNEVSELKTYYEPQVENKLVTLQRFSEKYPDILEDVIADLKELDEDFKSLESEYEQPVSKHQVIEAMVENYQLKLHMLEEIIEMTHELNQEENEATDI